MWNTHRVYLSAECKALSASSIALGGVSFRQVSQPIVCQASAPASSAVPVSPLPSPRRPEPCQPLHSDSSLGMSPLYHQDAKWTPRPLTPPARSTTTARNSDDKWPAPSSFLSNLRRTIRRKLVAFWDNSDKTSLTRHSRTSSLAPVPSLLTLKFIFQCCIWYASSAMSSNTGKSIMNQFRYPVTLTFVQFFFVASFCALFMSPLVRFSKFRPPTRAIFNATLPMGAFQVGGHIFSSMAISRIPVSTVHTIKVFTPDLLSIPLPNLSSRHFLPCSPLPHTPSSSMSATPHRPTFPFYRSLSALCSYALSMSPAPTCSVYLVPSDPP